MCHYSLTTSLADLRLAFLDVETTGLSAFFGDRVCEIAILRSYREEIEVRYQTLVNPGRRISPGAAAVNHISDADVANAPRFWEIATHVEELLKGVVVVCHNAPFDLSFIATEMQRVGRAAEIPWVIDTLAIARRCYSFRSNGLSKVARVLRIPTPDAHRAMGDAVTTREVYYSFVEDLYARGVRTLGDLLRAQGGSATLPPMTQDTLPPEVVEALGSGKRLLLKYVDGQGHPTERWVTPREVRRVGSTVALVAYCHLRNADRNFRLDRIVAMIVEG